MFPMVGLGLRPPVLRLTSLCDCEPWGAGEVGGHRGCLGGVALSLVSLQGQYRTVLYDSWVKQLMAHHVPHTAEPTLIGTLGNPVKIRSWQVPTLGVWSNRAGPTMCSGLGQEAPASLLPSLLGLLRAAFPEPAWGQSEAGGQERRKLSGTGAG